MIIRTEAHSPASHSQREKGWINCEGYSRPDVSERSERLGFTGYRRGGSTARRFVTKCRGYEAVRVSTVMSRTREIHGGSLGGRNREKRH